MDGNMEEQSIQTIKLSYEKKKITYYVRARQGLLLEPTACSTGAKYPSYNNLSSQRQQQQGAAAVHFHTEKSTQLVGHQYLIKVV